MKMLPQLGITSIINASQDLECDKPYYGLVEYMRVPVPDSPHVDIYRYFDRVAERIHRTSRRGGRTLVHCQQGVSRSSTLVMAYLMKYEGLTLSQAFTLVRRQRPIVNPNCGFWTQLMDYERKLYGYNTVSTRPGVNCY